MQGANAYLANVMRLLKKIAKCEGDVNVDGVKQNAPVLYLIIKELWQAIPFSFAIRLPPTSKN